MWIGKKIHSIILSVTCHGLRNFPPLIHIPHIHLWILKPLEFEYVKGWMWIEKNSPCHLSWLKKLSPTHTHPLIPFYFWNPKSYYFEFESFVKGWMWIGKKIHSIILSVTCHGLRNFPPLIHIPSCPFMNFWNPKSYYFLSLNHS